MQYTLPSLAALLATTSASVVNRANIAPFNVNNFSAQHDPESSYSSVNFDVSNPAFNLAATECTAQSPTASGADIGAFPAVKLCRDTADRGFLFYHNSKYSLVLELIYEGATQGSLQGKHTFPAKAVHMFTDARDPGIQYQKVIALA